MNSACRSDRIWEENIMSYAGVGLEVIQEKGYIYLMFNSGRKETFMQDGASNQFPFYSAISHHSHMDSTG